MNTPTTLTILLKTNVWWRGCKCTKKGKETCNLDNEGKLFNTEGALFSTFFQLVLLRLIGRLLWCAGCLKDHWCWTCALKMSLESARQWKMFLTEPWKFYSLQNFPQSEKVSSNPRRKVLDVEMASGIKFAVVF